MKIKNTLCFVSALLLVSFVAYATTVKPAWNQVDEKISFFKEKGFVFEITDLTHVYEKETIELVVVIPKAFKFNKLDNTFSHVLLFNDDIAVDVLSHRYLEKERVIITLSTAMAKKSKLYFYYKTSGKNGTDGTQFVITISSILEDLENKETKAQQKNPPDKK